MFDDRAGTPFAGVTPDIARAVYEQRLANWKHYRELYRQGGANGKGQLTGGFPSFVFDRGVHDLNWFDYQARRHFGTSNPRKDVWFWFASGPKYHELEGAPHIGEGFTDSEESAVTAAVGWALENYPEGIVWVRDAAIAGTRYKTAHAKKTKHKD